MKAIIPYIIIAAAFFAGGYGVAYLIEKQDPIVINPHLKEENENLKEDNRRLQQQIDRDSIVIINTQRQRDSLRVLTSQRTQDREIQYRNYERTKTMVDSMPINAVRDSLQRAIRRELSPK